ncbi:MAG: N-acetylneuraminate synthase [Candidatus Berkelbacteria bacterium]|nr:N-acetylneuraminate synthase [Candidatus Berkelbacteria bacterium]
MSETLIIAEAGVNHNGDMDIAKRLIASAANAGVNMVKFQTFKAKNLLTKNARMADYQVKNNNVKETQYGMIQRLELSRAKHHQLINHCVTQGVRFFSTGFDSESIDLLIELGVDTLKIPSGEITNLPYLRHIGRQGLPIILSTGMANLSEIEAALKVLEAVGTPRNQITVLHCNTDYPTPMMDVNLRAMCTIRDTFDVAVGYSDHTLGIEVPIAAVAMGATVIEKHFTLDRSLPGPDHKASLEPDELKAMVAAIRNIEKAMGDGIKRPSPSETKNIPIARKSVVAAKAIQAGDAFSDTNLTVKRPGTGISPMRWDELLGQSASRDYEPDELIEL